MKSARGGLPKDVLYLDVPLAILRNLRYVEFQSVFLRGRWHMIVNNLVIEKRIEESAADDFLKIIRDFFYFLTCVVKTGKSGL